MTLSYMDSHFLHHYSVYFAPRGRVRMTTLGMEIAREYLNPFDKLVGIVGEAGSGKSMLVRGMFPGLELTNDDSGINVRPLPLLEIEENSFTSAHTYHVDIRFESAFLQMHELAAAINRALSLDKRVVVEHFELIYPILQRNANLLIGVGREVIITRPNLFGPQPSDIAEIVFDSIQYRKMAHSAEDLVELALLPTYQHGDYAHGDVRYGFTIGFDQKPQLDTQEIEKRVQEMIDKDLPISYIDEDHVKIGDLKHPCTGPRMHVSTTGGIKDFHLLHDLPLDPISGKYLLAGLVGGKENVSSSDFNKFALD